MNEGRSPLDEIVSAGSTGIVLEPENVFSDCSETVLSSKPHRAVRASESINPLAFFRMENRNAVDSMEKSPKVDCEIIHSSKSLSSNIIDLCDDEQSCFTPSAQPNCTFDVAKGAIISETTTITAPALQDFSQIQMFSWHDLQINSILLKPKAAHYNRDVDVICLSRPVGISNRISAPQPPSETPFNFSNSINPLVSAAASSPALIPNESEKSRGHLQPLKNFEETHMSSATQISSRFTTSTTTFPNSGQAETTTQATVMDYLQGDEMHQDVTVTTLSQIRQASAPASHSTDKNLRDNSATKAAVLSANSSRNIGPSLGTQSQVKDTRGARHSAISASYHENPKSSSSEVSSSDSDTDYDPRNRKCKKGLVLKKIFLNRKGRLSNGTSVKETKIPPKRRPKSQLLCVVCGKTYTYLKSLYKHELIHTRNMKSLALGNKNMKSGLTVKSTTTGCDGKKLAQDDQISSTLMELSEDSSSATSSNSDGRYSSSETSDNENR